MVFLAIPSSMQESGEEWFVNQINKMTKSRLTTPHRVLPKKLLEPIPDSVKKEMKDFFEEEEEAEEDSGIKLNLQKPRRPSLKQVNMKWFEPIVLNHVVRTHDKRDHDFEGGYAICFENESEDFEGLVIFDVVLVSDEEEEEEDEATVLKREHLTPLEENLQESISAASSVLSEMRYMEKREARMRQTADSINSKVRFFSYVSVVILLGVTYVQVSYLKRYFRKKKLM